MTAMPARTTTDAPIDLRTYAAILKRFFARNFMNRVLLIAFFGTHIPLLTLLVWALIGNQRQISSVFALLLILAATLIGFGLTFYLLGVMLVPIRLTTRALEAHFKFGTSPQLPTDFDDEIGALMRGVQQNIERLDMNVMQLTVLSATDALTGAYNRAKGEQLLLEELDNAAKGEAVVLAVIDLDQLKIINDTHGHRTGDLALTLVSRAVRSVTRGRDWVARWGGDEFVLVLRDTPITNAKLVFQRLLQELQRYPLNVDGSSIAITVSIGATQIDSTDTAINAFERADELLYSVKNNGRNGYSISAA